MLGIFCICLVEFIPWDKITLKLPERSNIQRNSNGPPINRTLEDTTADRTRFRKYLQPPVEDNRYKTLTNPKLPLRDHFGNAATAAENIPDKSSAKNVKHCSRTIYDEQIMHRRGDVSEISSGSNFSYSVLVQFQSAGTLAMISLVWH